MENVTVEQALALILDQVNPISEVEDVELLKAGGRILAEDIRTEFDNPPFDRAPVDGYACRASDIKGASAEFPVTLKVIGEIEAGNWPYMQISTGEAVRIMTGAPIPKGSNCCIRQEDTDYGGKTVKIYRPEKEWGNYCFRGEDFRKGDVLLKKGTRLGFVETALLAGAGRVKVPVYKMPRIAVLTTGDEVTVPGKPLDPGKIYDSNQMLLTARLMEFGVEPVQTGAVDDDPELVGEKLKKASLKSDLIITTGAVSVGKKDIMHEALSRIGAERIFWRVKVKPGMPTLFSAYREIPILSLSGNPFGVAVMVELLARPLIAKLKNDASLNLTYVDGVMANSFKKKINGRRFIRAFWDGSKFHLPDGLHSNGVLSSMVGCNCLIDVKPGMPDLNEGVHAQGILL